MSVALGIQHAMRMRRTVLPSVACPALTRENHELLCHSAANCTIYCTEQIANSLLCDLQVFGNIPLFTTPGKWPTWRTITLHNTFIVIILCFFWCRIHLWFRYVGGLYGKSMTSSCNRSSVPSRLRAQHRNIITTRWRLCVTMQTL